MKRERTIQRILVDPYRSRVARVKVTDTLHRATGGKILRDSTPQPNGKLPKGTKGQGLGDTKDLYLAGKGNPYSPAHYGRKK